MELQSQQDTFFLQNLSKEEKRLFGICRLLYLAKLSYSLCDQHFENYVHILKINKNKKEVLMKESFLQYIISDILATDEYTLEGIATYTHTTLEVIIDIVTGLNTTPSYLLTIKLIELHFTLRKPFYLELMSKINPLEKTLLNLSIDHNLF